MLGLAEGTQGPLHLSPTPQPHFSRRQQHVPSFHAVKHIFLFSEIFGKFLLASLPLPWALANFYHQVEAETNSLQASFRETLKYGYFVNMSALLGQEPITVGKHHPLWG